MVSLSILILTHRKGPLLGECLRAVLDQLGPDDEVLVVDDGGWDHGIVRALREPQVRYIVVPHKGYRLATLQNIGTILCRHDAVVKLDGDCVPQPGWLDAIRAALRPGVLCTGRIDWETPDGSLRRDFRFTTSGEVSAEAKTFKGEWYLPQRVWGGNLAYWRPELLLLGGFSSEFDGGWGGEESDIGWRYHHAGLKIEFLYDAYVIHRYHPPNPARHDAARRRRNLDLVQQHREEYAKGIFPPPLSMPAIHVLVPHLGLRPPEETLYPCLRALHANTTLPVTYWIVLQEPREGTETEVRRFCQERGLDAQIVASPLNRGLAWPKAWVQRQLPDDAWLVNVDDDMLVPPDGIEQMWAVLVGEPRFGAAVLWSQGLDFGTLAIHGESLVKGRIQPRWPWTVANYAGFGCSMVRPEALRLCRFDDRYFVGAVDLDFSLQLRQAGWKIAVLALKAAHNPVRPAEYREVRFGRVPEAWKEFHLKWGLCVVEKGVQRVAGSGAQRS